MKVNREKWFAGNENAGSGCDGPPPTADCAAHRLLPRPVQLAGICTANAAGAALPQTGAIWRRGLDALGRRAMLFRCGLGSFLTFARELVANPRAVGAVCPSSSELAQAMARELGTLEDGLVLELGAGTGSITEALLRHGVPPARLVAVERSPALAAHLRERFPAIRVIEGDAMWLDRLLGSDAARVRAVVSGLPMRSLPSAVVHEIENQIRQLLPDNGVFVQFTYDLSTPPRNRVAGLRKARTRVVWRNLPPARVDTFIRPADMPRLADAV